MNFLNTIKSFFSSAEQNSKKTPIETVTKVPYDAESYIANQQAKISANATFLLEKYGADFNSIFYRQDLNTFIRHKILSLPELSYTYKDFLDHDYWDKKHPLNFPGPFYTGESDTCGTGDVEAPDNVMYDDYCCEYIFKQPQSYAELLRVIDAAAVEVFDSYSSNGNEHWTYQKCKEWWQNKEHIIEQLNTIEFRKVNGEKGQLYIDYLNGDAGQDLQKYCYFLENGIYPANEEILLPSL